MMLRTLLLAAVAVLVGTPRATAAQFELAAGALVASDAVVDGPLVGPALSLVASLARVGVPAVVELGVARTDFSSLGRDYHDDHLWIAVLAQRRLRHGATGLALRLGAGAYGEFQTVEGDPPTGGGDNWFDTVIAGVVVTRLLGDGRELVFSFSDALLGPTNAIFDPSEADVQHRFRILVGVRF
jgi:hypothetical protein